VDVVEVDPLKPEAAQGFVEVMSDLASAQRGFAGRAAVRIADLGRDLHITHERGFLRAQPLAEHGLARAAAVSVCSVEAAEPDAPRVIEQFERGSFAVAGVAQGGRRSHAAEIAAAEDDPVKFELSGHWQALAEARFARPLAVPCREVNSSVARLFGAIELDRVDEGEAHEAVLGPLNDGRDQNAALEADVNLGTWREVRDLVAHQPAFGNVMNREAGRRAVDQQLELPALDRHPLETPLV
jgi:hypothetical protein